jgi:hypothetical protein
MKLDSVNVRAVAIGLMPGLLGVRKLFGALGQIERFAMPMEKCFRRGEALKERIGRAAFGQVNRRPSDLELAIAVYASAQRLRDQLRSETYAQHRRARLKRLFDHLEFGLQTRKRIVNRHRAAQDDQPFGQARRYRLTQLGIRKCSVTAFKRWSEVAQVLKVFLTEDEDRHGFF